jgi:hypothetical protein
LLFWWGIHSFRFFGFGQQQSCNASHTHTHNSQKKSVKSRHSPRPEIVKLRLKWGMVFLLLGKV